MKLLNVKIEGFRNIDNAEIVLGKEMTTLVAENNYGKSNVIDGIDFAISFISASPAEKDALMQWRKGIPLNKKTENHEFKADFIFETEFLGGICEVNYGFSFVWIKKDGGKKIQKEWLNIRKRENAKKYTKLISRNSKAFYKTSQTGRCDNNVKIADNELVLNKLLNFDDLYYLPIIKELNNLIVYAERNFDAALSYMKNPFLMRNNSQSILSGSGNISWIIYQLKEEHNDQYEILKDAFMQLFPNITDITVEALDRRGNHDIGGDVPYVVPDKDYSIFVKDENLNQPLDFSSMSDGAKRVFLMLTAAVIANIEKVFLIAFEEPENSIHPSLLQGYLRVLSQLAGDCRIIVSSHSPYIVEYVPTEDIYIGKSNQYGLADFSRIDAKKVKRLLHDAMDYGVSVGSYIFNLLSRGEDAFYILNSYLEK